MGGIFDNPDTPNAIAKKENGVEITPEKIFTSGICLSLHIAGPGMRKKLHAEDIGKAESDIPDIFTLGSKRLIPKKYLDPFLQLEREARAAVDTHSYQFYIPTVKFIPKAALDGVLAKLQEIKEKFMAMADEFIDAYDKIKDEVKKQYPDHWDSLSPHYPSVLDLRWYGCVCADILNRRTGLSTPAFRLW